MRALAAVLPVAVLLLAGLSAPSAAGAPAGTSGAILPAAAGATAGSGPWTLPTAGRASTPATPTPPPPGSAPAASARIVAIYPNPVLEGDRGEFVVVEVPADTALGRLRLTDGEIVATLPNRTVGGRVALATDPVARNLTDVPLVLLDARLRLANDGERVALRRGDRLLDAVDYDDAPEGRILRRTDAGWAWRAVGATSFPPRAATAAGATLFVLPDAPAAALAPLRDADRRLWLAGYTLTSARVVAVLCAARADGVDVRVLLEGRPVGGMTATGAKRLDELTACGVPVRVLGGPHARYAFHHAKYAVADDRAVVLTENWKPAGVGGRSSRGWGAVVESPATAEALAATFAADAGWRDARPWPAVRAGRTYDRTESPANGTFAGAFTPAAVGPTRVELLVAPDNAERGTVAVLDDADASIDAVQVSVGGLDGPFVRALVRAARRGVAVRLLLADAWYVREDNRAVAAALERLAREEGLPLRVRLAGPRGRYEKVHAKGAVVDGRHVVLGSLNWNNASARRNREVVLVLHGEAAGRYFARVYRADWRGGRWRVPAGLVAVAVLAAAGAAAFGRRVIAFEAGREAGIEPPPPDGTADAPAFEEPY